MQQPRLYCVFDIKAETYSPPYVAENDAVADRYFADQLQSHPVLSRHPDHYRLFSIGLFDPLTGQVTPFEKVCINEGMSPGRPRDVAMAEEQGREKFAAWLAARGLVPADLQTAEGKLRAALSAGGQ